jgi:hypothetical protein
LLERANLYIVYITYIQIIYSIYIPNGIAMRIEIRKNNGKMGILISFDTQSQKFESHSERNKFYSMLYGRKQIVIRNSSRYEYRREGILDEIPHIKVDSSVFIVAMEHLRRMERFFDDWEDKVMFKTFPVLLDRSEMRELEKPREVKIEEE